MLVPIRLFMNKKFDAAHLHALDSEEEEEDEDEESEDEAGGEAAQPA